jgi:hypothetical protein
MDIVTITIKIPIILITEVGKSTLENIQKQKRPQVARSILSKKIDIRSITIPNFKLYYRAIGNKKIQHGTGTKTDMKTNGTEQNIQI